MKRTNPHKPDQDEFRPWRDDWRDLGHVVEYVRNVQTERYGRGYYERGTWVYPEPEINRPQCGDRWSYGDWETCPPAEASHVVFAGWSDYSGGCCDRANYEHVKETYPRSFIDVYGGHGTHAVLIPVTSRNPYLFRDIAGVIDYPLIDEERHSELEMREADEAWDSYLRFDVRHELSRTGLYGIDDVIEALDDSDNAQDPAGDSLRDWYYESLRDGNESPYLETAVNIVFPEHDKSMAYVTEKLWQWRAEEFAPPAAQDALPL
jgi:hypothetical protein